MYQVVAELSLWEMSARPHTGEDQFSPRGYDEDQVALPAELRAAATDDCGAFRALSVDKIASKFCPTRRDLYLEHKVRRAGDARWGRVAGRLVQKYVEGLVVAIGGGRQVLGRESLRELSRFAEQYAGRFWSTQQRAEEQLRDLTEEEVDDPDWLKFRLRQTGALEAAMAGVTRRLAKGRQSPLAWARRVVQGPRADVPLVLDSAAELSPAPHLGLGRVASPDFIVREPVLCIGDVKSGLNLEPHHRLAVTGYALAYESQHREEVDIGVVYFFQNHSWSIEFPRTCLFMIDSAARRDFLYARNSAYQIVTRESAPDRTTDIDPYCHFCKFRTECYPE